jgi:rare lipoprotein A
MAPGRAVAVLLAGGVLAGCAARPSSPAAHPPAAQLVPRAVTPFQVGVASYYSDRLAGHVTANGERYDPRALTAAHRSLPLGTVVEVVREGGARVRVRINDRGPYVDGRVLDLSRRAAESLGMIRAGLARVAIYVVSVPPRAGASSRRASDRR